MGKKRACPLTREEAEERIRGYFGQCGDKRRPTRPGLRAALGLREEELQACEKGEKGFEELQEPVCLAMDRMRDELEQGSGNVNLFLLKQPCYGGYTDKPAAEDKGGPVEIRVVFGNEKEDLGG